MKKGETIECTIETLKFPNKGMAHVTEENIVTPTGPAPSRDTDRLGVGMQVETTQTVVIKNALPGQRVSARILKKRNGRYEASLQSVLSPAKEEKPVPCGVFGICGGCLFTGYPYEEELQIKESQVRDLLSKAIAGTNLKTGELARLDWFEPIHPSPVHEQYRNKMEFTFGDEVKDGPLTLGLHKRGSFYDICSARDCLLVDGDFRQIVHCTQNFFTEREVPFYHRMKREGYLRHLLVRKASHTGEILIDLVTTTQRGCLVGTESEKKQELPLHVRSGASVTSETEEGNDLKADKEKAAADSKTTEIGEEVEQNMLQDYVAALEKLPLQGTIAGILHTRNDSIADIVEDQGTEVLYGRDYFQENILGLQFDVTPFSFFQTNSYAAEVLYSTAREYIGEAITGSATSALQEKMGSSKAIAGGAEKPIVFDLYCGTGTISQLVAPAAKEVVGVEIVEEAVRAARENAKKNGISNCRFIAGDVLKAIDEIEEKPNVIILDPPRDGIHPKALPKILAYGVPYILYISCKPTSLARDLPGFLLAGYLPVRGTCVDQFPRTANVETVVLLSNKMRSGRTM